MQKLITAFVASITLAAAASNAGAATVTADETLPAGQPTVLNNAQLINIGNSFSYPYFWQGGYVSVVGTTSGNHNPPNGSALPGGATSASPFTNLNTSYNYVAVTTQDWNTPGVQYLGVGQVSFGDDFNQLSFIWGSPDPYNYIEFYNNGVLVDTVYGNDSAIVAAVGGTANLDGKNGHLAVYVSILLDGGDVFDTIRLFTQDQNAFEFAGIAASSVCTVNCVPEQAPDPTPLPGAVALFGSVLAGGVGFGAWRRRRKAA